MRNRNSARYCKATLLRLLVAATEHTENILQNNATVLQTAVGESEHQFEPSQTGDGKVWFSAGLSQETCLGVEFRICGLQNLILMTIHSFSHGYGKIFKTVYL